VHHCSILICFSLMLSKVHVETTNNYALFSGPGTTTTYVSSVSGWNTARSIYCGLFRSVCKQEFLRKLPISVFILHQRDYEALQTCIPIYYSQNKSQVSSSDRLYKSGMLYNRIGMFVIVWKL